MKGNGEFWLCFFKKADPRSRLQAEQVELEEVGCRERSWREASSWGRRGDWCKEGD